MKIAKQQLNDRLLIGEYVFFFLKNDKFCSEIIDKWSQEWGEKGLIEMFCKIYFKSKPKIINIVPWFMDRVFDDIQSNTFDKQQLKKFIDFLNKNDIYHLENVKNISQKYNIKPDILRDFKRSMDLIDDNNDKASLLFSYFCDLIFHSEVIILNSILNKVFK